MQRKSLSIVSIIWLAFVVLWGSQAWINFKQQGYDFELYYAIGELLRIQPTGVYLSGEQGPFYGYSPIVSPFFTYLSYLPHDISRTAFFAFKPFLFALWPWLFCYSISKKLSVKNLAWAALACAAVSPAVFEESAAGNINLYLLTFLFCATVLANHGRVLSSATIITVIAAFKPQYTLFFIPVLCLNPLQAIGGGFLAMGLLFAQTFLFISPTILADHFQRFFYLLSIPLASPNDVNNMSTNGYIQRMLTAFSLEQAGDLKAVNLWNLSSTIASTTAKIVMAILAVCCLTTVLPVLKSLRNNAESLAFWFATIVCLTLVVTPVIWLTHFMLLGFALFVLCFALSKYSSWASGLLLMVVASSYYLAGQFLHPDINEMIRARAYGYPYLALCLFVLLFTGFQIRLFLKKRLGPSTITTH